MEMVDVLRTLDTCRLAEQFCGVSGADLADYSTAS